MKASYKVLARIRDNVKSVQAHGLKPFAGDVFETIRSFSDGFVRCTCGGGVMLDPNDLMYGTSWGGCSHLVAMFRGRVIEDRNLSIASYAGQGPARPYVELTPEGRNFFGWRWAAIAMEK